MPEITNVDASYSRKVQLDDFEPINHTVTLQAELGEDEDAEAAYEELSDRAEDMVERAIAARLASKKMDDEEDDE